MFHQNRFDGFIGQKPPFGMAAPIKNQTCHQSSLWSTVLNSHRTLVIPERLSKSAGFIDSSQSIISSGMIFLFVVPPFSALHNPGKVPGTYRHRLHGQPRQPLPGHTRKITFVTMMSAFKFSLRLELAWFAGILFFLFRGCLSFVLYSVTARLSFY